jgi:PAS domain S-box-containing protein
MTPIHSPNYQAEILLVDDTPANLHLLVNILRKKDYKVRAFTNGNSALEAVQSRPPDLILLDILMPELDGYTVCQTLKADPQTSEIPVIFLSALSDGLDKTKAFQLGGADYITKPFQVEELLARVENQLTLRSLQTQLRQKNQELTAQNVQLQQEIAERQRGEMQIRLLLAATQAISHAQDLNSALGVILSLICQAIQWDYGEAWLESEDGKVLKCAQTQSIRDSSLSEFIQTSWQLTFAPGIGLPGRIWVSKQPEWIEDVSSSPLQEFLRSQIAANAGLKAAFGVPILVNDQVLAILIFYGKQASTCQPRIVELELVNAVISQLGSLIQHKQAEQALRQSEERWQLVLGGTGDGIFDWNITTGGAFASARLLEMLGYTEQEFAYSYDAWRSLVYPEDIDPTIAALQAHLEGKTGQYAAECRLRCKDGSYKWVLARGQAQWDESGKPLRMVGTHQDISDRKLAEEEVQLLLTISQAISAAPDFDTAIEIALQQVCSTTGWTYGEAWIPTTDKSALVCSPRWYCQRTGIDPTVAEVITNFRKYSEVLTFLPGEEIPGQVWSTEQSHWVAQLSTIDDVLLRLELATASGLKAGFGVPIIAVGNRNEQAEEPSSYLLSSHSPVLAVLVFFTRSTRFQDKRFGELVKVVAAQSGTVLQQKKVQAEMKALFAAMTDVVTVRDVSGRCLNVIPTNTTNLYKPPAEMIGRKLHDDLPSAPADLIRQSIIRAVSTQKTVSIEYCLPLGGKDVWLAETISPLNEETAILVARDISDQKLAEQALRKEQEKSEQLLLNILPEPIANQLKQNKGTLANRGVALAEQFNEVTIMFADIVDFTPLSARLKPIELVSLLNQIFSTFDELAQQLGLEKIKTIGDAYMVAAGLPIPKADHASSIAQMALDMQKALAWFNAQTGEGFQLRIGINIGPVVAGVIGMSKFSYDLWGDTVNIASRMESTGMPGKIQVTAAIYERLKEQFCFEERGAIVVKGKGKMLTYWLTGKTKE